MIFSTIDFMIEIKEKHKSQQRTNVAENLLNHAHAEILPPDALIFKFLHFKWSFFLSYSRTYVSFPTFSNWTKYLIWISCEVHVYSALWKFT